MIVNPAWGYAFLENVTSSLSGIQIAKARVEGEVYPKRKILKPMEILRIPPEKRKEESHYYLVFDEEKDEHAFEKAINIASYQYKDEKGDIRFIERALYLNKLHTTAILFFQDEKEAEWWVGEVIKCGVNDPLITTKTARVTTKNLQNFIEKIKLLKIGINDLVFELFKSFIVDQSNGQIDEESIHFDGETNEAFLLRSDESLYERYFDQDAFQKKYGVKGKDKEGNEIYRPFLPEMWVDLMTSLYMENKDTYEAEFYVNTKLGRDVLNSIKKN